MTSGGSSALGETLRAAWARPQLRLVLFGLAGVLAVFVGFVAVPVKMSEEIVKRGGYYLMAGTFALFLHALWRLRQRTLDTAPALAPLTRRQWWLATGLITALSLLAINAEPYYSKILNDEFVLQSTAFNMHYFRDVATMVRGYDIQGVFLSTDNYLDKRPYFYPFLVSLVHDSTGYRMANAFLLNSALMPVTLGLAFAFARRMAGWGGGVLAVLLLGSLPLLGQNATGSGMELLNVAMILVALLLATTYLRQPDEGSLAAFLLGVVLLAQSRYESALYVGAAALVVVLGWWRVGRILLSWQAVIVPLLLIPSAMQHKVLSNTPMLWELQENQTMRFSVEYLAGNLRGAWAFWFSRSPERANSLMLSGAGLVALLWGVWQVGRHARRLREASPAALALVCFAVAVLANTALVFFYYWSNFDDPMASRFSLPLYLLCAFAIVRVAADWDWRLPATVIFTLAAGLWAVPSAGAKFGHHYYSHLGIDEIEWQRRYINARTPGQRLILTNRSSLPWLLQETPSILLDRARLVADRVAHQMKQPTFREILVLQTLRPTTVDGDHQLPPEERLPEFFKLETLVEKRFGTKLARISRLVAVDLPANWTTPGVKKTTAATTTAAPGQ